MTTVGIGLRIKTAKTIAVAVAVDAAAVTLVDRREIRLSDPAVAASSQPYHAGLESQLGERDPVVVAACDAVFHAARQNVEHYLRTLSVADLRRPLGIVVNSLQDPNRLKNDHIRAHALEGRLFFESVERAVTDLGFRPFAVLSGDYSTDAAVSLGLAPQVVTNRIQALGKTAGPPWRADEKAACAAAWIAAACEE